MSILIKGLGEMPKEGNETILRLMPDGTVLDQYGHHLALKAVPVPKHGRLIDADAMSEKDNNDFSATIGTAEGFATKQLMVMAHALLQKAIEIQPTIIPASED